MYNTTHFIQTLFNPTEKKKENGLIILNIYPAVLFIVLYLDKIRFSLFSYIEKKQLPSIVVLQKKICTD